jgi:hypothetical protein
VVAAIIAGLGVGHFGYIAWQTATFGRLMHRIIETVAKQVPLTPVAPLASSPLPVGSPRTA